MHFSSKLMLTFQWAVPLAVIFPSSGVSAHPAPEPVTPSALYGSLYDQVEMSGVYADSKTFADARAKGPVASILADYRAAKPKSPDQLRDFVGGHFDLPADADVPAPSGEHKTLALHIADLWPNLIRGPLSPLPGSSQLAFGFAHVVPGGRFREIYYWDSYFTMLGLIRDGHANVASDMVKGFADIIMRYGHMPNGTRSYYLSRSQPPFFYLMAGLTSPKQPALGYALVLPVLRREHAFWMDGEAGLKPGHAAAHVVKLADGTLLNRYWDRSDTPRDESYREDVLLAAGSGRDPHALYRDIRSAAESGWDFSSRWLADGKTLASIETTRIVPVDLNALLYGLERAIAQGCTQTADQACVKDYSERASRRQAAITRYLWQPATGRYLDYQWQRGAPTYRLSAATLYPLFTGAANAEQAAAVAKTVRTDLLSKGGLATTTVTTGQQWDAPNGWAPLQWIAVSGLAAYGEHALADVIAQRWLQTVQMSYDARGKLVEKYDVQTQSPGGGGEYPLQDGFGWTNGVTRALMDAQSAGIH